MINLFDNMPENLPTWLVFVGGALGAVGGWFATFRKQEREDNRKDREQDTATRLTENTAALQIYKEVIITLQEDRKKLEQHIVHQETSHREEIIRREKEHQDCKNENVKLQMQIVKLEMELKELRKDFDFYRGQNATTDSKPKEVIVVNEKLGVPQKVELVQPASNPTVVVENIGTQN